MVFLSESDYLEVFYCLFISALLLTGESIIKTGKFRIPFTVLTPPLFACAWTTSYTVVFFVFSELRLEVIVRFVDIGGIVNHHC